jgi:hypothetical protein
MSDGHPNTLLALVRGREGRRREANSYVSPSRVPHRFPFTFLLAPTYPAPLKPIDEKCGLHPKSGGERPGKFGCEGT